MFMGNPLSGCFSNQRQPENWNETAMARYQVAYSIRLYQLARWRRAAAVPF
nr:hypothetical protein [uncultured Kingella sp.]